MKLSNVRRARSGFQVIETREHAQSAIMTLKPGESSSDEPNKHPRSDQTLLLLAGRLNGVVGRRRVELKRGDFLTVPAGTPHRFSNDARTTAVTFNVYSPPPY